MELLKQRIARVSPRVHVGPAWLVWLALSASACATESSPPVGVDAGIDAGSDTGAVDVSCPAEQTACGGQCVDTRASAQHCGACGMACAAGQVCVNGACMQSCPGTQTLCNNSVCVSTATDREHCGACGNVCPAGQVCSNGRCATTCASNLQGCMRAPSASGDAGAMGELVCVDPMTDRAHCGGCNNVCPRGRICEAGACVLTCIESQTVCDGACRDLQTDRAHCGACATACTAGQVCAEGRCVVSCGAGFTVCNGVCRDLRTDRNHCGGCGSACISGQVCNEGVCEVSCSPGLSACTSGCRDLQTDRLHCGACDRACPAGQVCTNGACQVSCSGGLTNCAGLCRDTSIDGNNCGTCGRVCPSGQVCSGGFCATTCGAPLLNCSGACVDPRNDPSACGGCTPCAATPNAPSPICRNSACELGTCNTGFGDCNRTYNDGCETNLRTSPDHCGACGNRCAAGLGCVNGACVVLCSGGLTFCNGACVNTQTDGNHCGACGRVCTSGQSCIAGACVNANGTVLSTGGQTIPVLFVPCGSGSISGCTEPVARASCTSIGRQLVSHASDGVNGVSSLGATASCQHSISYYTNSSPTVAGQCLVGVSNAQWSDCCTRSRWHGNTVRVPTTLGQVFGYVNTSNSGYRSDLPNAQGTPWGCTDVGSPASATSGCTTYYVACR